MEINWMEEVLKRKDDLVKDTQTFLQIKSVLDEENSTAEAPFGEGIRKAFHHLLEKGESDGFIAKNVDELAGHLEFGSGEELLGILCHIDVVPEGDGWTSDPYRAEIRDGKIYARGAMDDKGPTMAAYYAMKIVKELGLPINKRVRMIIGTDEESNWRCVDHYFKHEEMPTMGFAPDADFPIIYAEKGILDFELKQQLQNEKNDSHQRLEQFQSGRRLNMVPDFARAVVTSDQSLAELKQSFESYLVEKDCKGQANLQDNRLTLELEGISAHGMEPNKGKNAGLLMVEFLTSTQLDQNAASYIDFVKKNFVNDSRGNHLGVAFKDDISGELTINVGRLSFDKDNGGSLGINLRYPVTNKIDETIRVITEKASVANVEIVNIDDSKPHHVPKDDPLIQTLQQVYEQQTGEEANLIAIGGGTYARSLKAGVAFGPLFPGRPDVAHQKDEYIEVEDLIKATAIYAQAIFELTK